MHVTPMVGGADANTRFRETGMFSIDRFARVATASVGALLLSSISIAAAVGPVRAAGVDRSEVAALAKNQANG
jgi:hypothetical protein